MSGRLTWDDAGSRTYETGVKMGVLYPQSTTGTYPKGVAWNGLTSISESPSGAESNPQYADDIKYLDLYSAEEFGATINAFTYPDEFEACDGSASPVAGVTIGQQNRTPFGLCYRTTLGNDTQGNDHGYKLHIIYGAKASPSEKGYNTINDSPEAIEFSWEVTTTPVSVEGYKPTATLVINSTKVDATKLAALEDILYGSPSADARLPLPAEIISILGGTGNYDIILNRSNATVAVNGTIVLKATTTPANEEVTWTSSSTSVAEVEDGVVTGISTGSATITASFTEDTVTYSDTCAVTVVSAS